MFNETFVASGAQSPDFRVWEQILCDAGVPQDRVQVFNHSEIELLTSLLPTPEPEFVCDTKIGLFTGR
jgi:hypothetical protein